MTTTLTHHTTPTATGRSAGPGPTATVTATEPGRIPVMLAALHALILANGVQIAAGLAQLELSPPAQVLPLLAATVALGVAAVPLVRAGQRLGSFLAIGFCALSLIGMGPHKLFLENGLVIGPLALTGFAFELVLVRAAVPTLRHR